MDHGDISWMLISSALVLLMTRDLHFFMGVWLKRKSVVNMIMSSAIMMGIGSIMWVLVGFSLSFSGDIGGVIGNLNWFGLNFNTLTDVTLPYPNTLIFAIFQMMFAVIAPALITGAVAERMKFSSLVIFMVLWSLLIYYPLAHMVWGGGLLFQMGSVDFAGGDVVHISSGVSALVLSIILGNVRILEKHLIIHTMSPSCFLEPHFCGLAGLVSTQEALWEPMNWRLMLL